jgi:hypothetical protein
MPNAQAICNSFKQELGVGTHNFTLSTGDVFKIALYTSASTMGAATTVYAATNEVVGTGYTAGGATLTNVTPVLSGSTAVFDFADVSWSTSTFTARGALIYNTSKSNKAVMSLDFGSDQVVSSGTFSVVYPTPDSSNAILRLT